jgi:hypothetical protein
LFVPLHGALFSGGALRAQRTSRAHARRGGVFVRVPPLRVTPPRPRLPGQTSIRVVRRVVGELAQVKTTGPRTVALGLVGPPSQVRRNVLFHTSREVVGHAVLAVPHHGLHFLFDVGFVLREELHELVVLGAAAGRLTTDLVEDSWPALVAPNGIPMCVWSVSNLLVYSALGIWNPQPIYSQAALADQATSLAAVTLPGGAAVAYPAGTTDGSDVFAALYDATVNRWSQPRRLTFDEHVENSLSLAFDGTQLLLSCLRSKTIRTNLTVESNNLTHRDLLEHGDFPNQHRPRGTRGEHRRANVHALRVVMASGRR